MSVPNQQALPADSRWTADELRAAVAAYAELMRAERRGEVTDKSAIRQRVLAGELSQRTAGAYEYRMQNISAVLDEHGCAWVAGYKPMRNVGPEATDLIWAAIQSNAPDLLSLAPEAPGNASRAPIDYIVPLFQWEERTQNKKKVVLPNTVDSNNEASIKITAELFDALGVERDAKPPMSSTGSAFERAVREMLTDALPRLDADRQWDVRQPGGEIADYGQYRHFHAMRQLVESDAVLSAGIGIDYDVKLDVAVCLPRQFTAGVVPDENRGEQLPLLHAALSCKWTLRSDRAQNVRTEATRMIRHRTGRLPHIIVVTAEGDAARIGSIARGTGEVDTVAHVALPQLKAAMQRAGYARKADQLSNLEAQGRLIDFAHLPELIADA